MPALTTAAPAAPLIALVGLPNSGKTTVFNALTGSNYRTVNYPGSTVDCAIGAADLDNRRARVMDLPGITSLDGPSPDEQVAIRALFGDSPHGAPSVYVAIADSTQLPRHLYPAKRLIDAGYRVVVAVTMVDILNKRKHLSFDAEALSRELGCPVVRVDARTGVGLKELRRQTGLLLEAPTTDRAARPAPLSAGDISARYQFLENVTARVVTTSTSKTPLEHRLSICMPDPLTARLDRVFLHPAWGFLVFAAIMTAIFTSIFWLAQPMMDGIDRLFSAAAAWLQAVLPDVWLTRLLTDGVILGVGAVAVFIPQIVILFLALGFLEDSGYLSRGAMIVDKPLAMVGLSGRAFVPILSGFACAIPAMLSTRTIPSARERLLTIFILPLMVCSARLPVYGLLIAFLTPPGMAWLGGLGMTALYLFSVLAGLLAAALFGKIFRLEKSVRPSLLLELPAIRRPKLRVALATTYHRTKSYIQKAGGTILCIAVALWALTHLPPRTHLDESAQLAGSYAAVLGQWLEPVMRPLGLDWRVGVALICAFAAREVFVGALALVLMVSAGGDAIEGPLILAMRNATLADGSPLFTFSSCVGLIIFFGFALQCMSTVAVSRKETGGWYIPTVQLVAFTALAYLSALAAVQGLRWAGIA
ncbi:ferrous iron transporter B [bacterium]|nr:ferrous iron transporter B [bacterium]